MRLMATRQEIQRQSEVLDTTPLPLSPAEVSFELDRKHESSQKLANHYIGAKSATVGIYHENAHVIGFSDIHIGADSTDMSSVREFKAYLEETPNAYAVINGDLIEYLTIKYLKTNILHMSMNPEEQIDYVRENVLQPLAENGKILCMVTDYFGHEGWEDRMNVWRRLVYGLNIPLIRNGSVLHIVTPSGHVENIDTNHYTQGKSNFDPVHALREKALRTTASKRQDGYLQGHIHVSGEVVENYPGLANSIFYIVSGTAKGSNPELPPDPLGPLIGGDYTDPLGEGVVLSAPSEITPELHYPAPSLERAKTILTSINVLQKATRSGLIFQAENMLERTESQGITREVVEQIRAQVEPRPKVKFLKTVSEKLTHSPYVSKFRDQTIEENSSTIYPQVFNKIVYEVETAMPIIFYPVGNVRLGSNSEGTRPFKAFLQEFILENPHALYTLMRNTLEPKLYKLTGRKQQLDRLVNLCQPTQEQLIAILGENDGLFHDGWKKSVGQGSGYGPIAPANYIADKLNTPVAHDQTRLEIALRTPGRREKLTYSSVLIDTLIGQTRIRRPIKGLKSYHHNWGGDYPGAFIGGKSESSGRGTFYDRNHPEDPFYHLIAPGWFAYSNNARGKGPGAQPGQALIYMPGSTYADHMSFATASLEESRFLFESLFALRGSQILGITDSILG